MLFNVEKLLLYENKYIFTHVYYKNFIMGLLSAKTEEQYHVLNLKEVWHLAYYVPVSIAKDTTNLSDRLGRFKNNDREVVNNWCRWTMEELRLAEIHYDVIIRVLGHAELHPSLQSPLDELGRNIAVATNGEYRSSILKKNRVTRPLHYLNRDERKREIANAYEVDDKRLDLTMKNVLIIDDITTSATTIEEILRALRVEWPDAEYSLFCLGRTDHYPQANQKIIMPDYFN